MRRSDAQSFSLPLVGEGRGEGARGEAAAGPLAFAQNSSGQAGEAMLRQLLFAPHSIALIGQSNDAGKTAGRPLKFLRQAGFAGSRLSRKCAAR